MIQSLPTRFFLALEAWNMAAVASSRRIPLPEGAAERPSKPPPPEDDERPYVLVVDDERDIVDVLRDLLQDANYRVKTARHGAEALDILDKDYERYFAAYYRDEPLPPRPIPDVILLDVMMDHMDGQEFFAIMRTSRPQFRSAKIIAMSAGVNIERFKEWVLSIDGPDSDTHAVKKPFVGDHILDAVAAACRAHANGNGGPKDAG